MLLICCTLMSQMLYKSQDFTHFHTGWLHTCLHLGGSWSTSMWIPKLEQCESRAGELLKTPRKDKETLRKTKKFAKKFAKGASKPIMWYARLPRIALTCWNTKFEGGENLGVCRDAALGLSTSTPRHHSTALCSCEQPNRSGQAAVSRKGFAPHEGEERPGPRWSLDGFWRKFHLRWENMQTFLNRNKWYENYVFLNPSWYFCFFAKMPLG